MAAGEALFIAAERETLLKAGSDGPSRSLHFLLMPAAGINTPVETGPAVVTELSRSPEPIPGLKPGAYEFNLTRLAARSVTVALGRETLAHLKGCGQVAHKSAPQWQ